MVAGEDIWNCMDVELYRFLFREKVLSLTTYSEQSDGKDWIVIRVGRKRFGTGVIVKWEQEEHEPTDIDIEDWRVAHAYICFCEYSIQKKFGIKWDGYMYIKPERKKT